MFEKKNGKRFLASVMALVMLLSLAPVGALAAESPAVTLPAEEGSTPAVVDTPSEDTPTTQPAVDPRPVVADPVESSSEAVILPEGDPLDPAFGVNPDTSNSNDIAEYKDGNSGNNGDKEPVTTDSTTEYVIRFYVSNTGTEDSYKDTADEKYVIKDQPNSTYIGAVGESKIELSVAPGYAILTEYNDEAKDISTDDFENVNITGDENVRTWRAKYAKKGVPTGLTQSNNVDAIVEYVNNQYRNNSKGYELPTLNEGNYNAFRFVDAHYVDQGESSIHVHVQLIKQQQYIVEYNPNGGTGAMVDENLYFEKQEATVKANEFTKTGYTFAGWNTEVDGTGTSYNPNGDNNKVTIGTENVTLYAQWTPQTYRINYELYSGTNAKINPTGYTYGEGVSSFAPATKDNYNFEGWYSEPEFRNKVESISTTDTGDKTLYAHWTEDPATRPTTTDVYVYFKMVDAAGKNIPKTKINNEALKNTVYNADAGGATWATLGKIALTGDITENTLTNAGEEAQVQLKNADNLCNKNKDIAQTVLANVQWFQLKQWAGATDYVPDGSRWHLDGKITGYTVTYNNGTTEATADDVHNMPVDEMYYLRGSEYTVSDATPTREGYVFTGWKSDNNVYDSESKMTMPAKNVVLTAQWEKDELVDPSVDKPEGIKGDGIADKYQIQVSFEAMNGTFEGCTSPANQYTQSTIIPPTSLLKTALLSWLMSI